MVHVRADDVFQEGPEHSTKESGENVAAHVCAHCYMCSTLDFLDPRFRDEESRIIVGTENQDKVAIEPATKVQQEYGSLVASKVPFLQALENYIITSHTHCDRLISNSHSNEIVLRKMRVDAVLELFWDVQTNNNS